MRKMCLLALALFACWTADARAFEFKNVRALYGPFGTPRPEAKMLPGDIYMVYFDLAGIAIDGKGVARYEMTLEVFDTKGKQVLKQNDKKGVVVALGGTTVPEFVVVGLGTDLDAGKYKIIVTIEEDGTKKPKKLEMSLELLPKGFGLIHVAAPAIGLTGQDYVLEYSLVGMEVSGKDKMPKVTVTMRVLDASGKPTTAEPIVSKVPEDFLPEQRAEIAKRGFARVGSQMLLNRPGRFTVEIDIRDEIGKKNKKFSYTLTVIDAVGK